MEIFPPGVVTGGRRLMILAGATAAAFAPVLSAWAEHAVGAAAVASA